MTLARQIAVAVLEGSNSPYFCTTTQSQREAILDDAEGVVERKLAPLTADLAAVRVRLEDAVSDRDEAVRSRVIAEDAYLLLKKGVAA